MSELEAYGDFKSFENRKRINEKGLEYWSARDFGGYLGYEMPKAWENFIKVIKKAKETAKGVNLRASDHFREVKDMIETGRQFKEFFASQGLDPLSLPINPPIKKLGKDLGKLNLDDDQE